MSSEANAVSPEMGGRPLSDEAVVAATQHWLVRAVIGLNLCPFAKAVHAKGQIRYVVSEARDMEGALTELEAELKWLAEADPAQVDTTLLILPRALGGFLEFNDCVFFAERLVDQLGLHGIVQIASFHLSRSNTLGGGSLAYFSRVPNLHTRKAAITPIAIRS